MTTPRLFPRRPDTTRVPRGDVLMTLDTSTEAQSVVNRLAKANHPMADIAIVGRDLVTVEHITGRLTYARVALSGAISGAWFGMFFGAMLTLTSDTYNAAFVPASVAIGVGLGLILRLVFFAVRRNRQEYTSASHVIASAYDVIVPAGTADRARLSLDTIAPVMDRLDS